MTGNAAIAEGEDALDAWRRPIVLMPAADRALLPPLPETGAATAWLLGEGNAWRLESGGRETRLASPPALCLGLLGASDAGMATLAEFATWVATCGSAVPAPLRLTADNLPAATAQVAKASIAVLLQQAALLTSTLGSLATLRAVRDDQQQRLSTLEAFLARRNTQPFELAFSEPPDDAQAELALGGAGGAAQVCQLLPVSSRGVAGIALHVAVAPPDAGALEVTLTSCEDDQLCGAWTVPPEQLSTGWLVLGLDAALVGLNRSLRLCVRPATPGGRAALSLGRQQPLPMFRATAGPDGAALADRSLAFRVWAGLPGLTPPAHAIDRLPDGAAPLMGFSELPIDARGLRLAAAPKEPFKGDRVLPLVHEAAIAVHPPRHGITIALLPGALAAETILASAEVSLGNAQSAPVQVALAALVDLAAVQAAAASGGPPGIGWSGWTSVVADSQAQIRLSMPAGPGPPRDLALLARMQEPGSNAFAWTKFKRLTATLLTCEVASAIEPEPAQPPRLLSGPVMLAPLAMQGEGFYSVEGDDQRSWRWFGPDTTLLLRDIPPEVGSVTLLIASAALGVALEGLQITVNGTAMAATIRAEPDGGWRLLIPVPAPLIRPEGVVRLRIVSANAHAPPGDARTLAIACIGLLIGED